MDEAPIFEDGRGIENIAIEAVRLDVPHGEHSATSVAAIARLAQCPAVREFRTGTLTSEFVTALLGGASSIFLNLTSLQVNKYEGTLDRLIALTSGCPNLRSIQITSAGITDAPSIVPR